jgi:hypothetical protein
MNLTDIFTWEIETIQGDILSQYNKDGSVNSWKKLPTGQPLSFDSVVRVSLIPTISLFTRHDCFIDIANGERFIKRFARGFLKMGSNGLTEYVHIIVTNKYRMHIFSSTGSVKITNPNYEFYL